MNHEAILQLFIEKKTDTDRNVLVEDSLDRGEVHVTKKEIRISSSFVSPSTDLEDLADQCRRMEWDFDTRRERERRKITAELTTLIRARFSRLHTLDPEQAAQLLKELKNGSTL